MSRLDEISHVGCGDLLKGRGEGEWELGYGEGNRERVRRGVMIVDDEGRGEMVGIALFGRCVVEMGGQETSSYILQRYGMSTNNIYKDIINMER